MAVVHIEVYVESEPMRLKWLQICAVPIPPFHTLKLNIWTTYNNVVHLVHCKLNHIQMQVSGHSSIIHSLAGTCQAFTSCNQQSVSVETIWQSIPPLPPTRSRLTLPNSGLVRRDSSVAMWDVLHTITIIKETMETQGRQARCGNGWYGMRQSSAAEQCASNLWGGPGCLLWGSYSPPSYTLVYP